MATRTSAGKLVQTLRAAGMETSFTELRDILWLAPHLAARTVPAAPGASAPVAPAPATSPAVATGGGETDGKAAPGPLRRTGTQDGAVSLVALADRATAGTQARLVRLRGMPALLQANAIGRALRPLARRRVGHRQVLDERATAEFIAATLLRAPVFRPAQERWFDIVLAIDEVPSMLAWKSVLAEFERLLRRQGGFRSLRTIRLVSGQDTVTAHGADGALLPLRALHDRTGRMIVLVLSDCTSAAWWHGHMGAFLARLGRQVPLTVAQLLPEALWPNTATGFAELRAVSPAVGSPTATLRLQLPAWARDEPGAALPVLELAPAAVAQWARMMTCAGNAWSPAALFPLPEPDWRAGPAVAPDAEQAMHAFRASATLAAQQLATYFSVVKPLTAPVMRVIQQAMAPEGGAMALAQVLLGGLLYPLAQAAPLPDPEQVEYEFHAGLRERFAQALSRRHFLQVNMALHDYLQQKTGTQFDFFALLADAQGDLAMPPDARAFAQFNQGLPERFAGTTQSAGGMGTLHITREDNTLVFRYAGAAGTVTLHHRFVPALAAMLMREDEERSGIANLRLAGALLPEQLPEIIRLAEQDSSIELVLDAGAGAYPWEYLLKSADPAVVPLAISHGLTRAVSLQPGRAAGGSGALLIGDPLIRIDGMNALPAAQAEAGEIARILQASGMPDVTLSVGGHASEIMRELHGRPLQVLHIAAHSIKEMASEQSSNQASAAGVVKILIGGDLRFGARDFEQLRQMPELVFLGVHYGAEMAPELIRLGAQVVVAPSGSIADDDARTFAVAFFGMLGQGSTLIDAMRGARLACRRAHPSSDVWGRFQCHGPATWRLEPAGVTAASAPFADPAPQRKWVLVAGSSLEKRLSEKLDATCAALGTALADDGFGLITGGWPGVDAATTAAFSRALEAAGIEVQSRMVRISDSSADAASQSAPSAAANGLSRIRGGMDRAQSVVLIGGFGKTKNLGKKASEAGLPVFPLADTGGDALWFHNYLTDGIGGTTRWLSSDDLTILKGPAPEVVRDLMSMLHALTPRTPHTLPA